MKGHRCVAAGALAVFLLVASLSVATGKEAVRTPTARAAPLQIELIVRTVNNFTNPEEVAAFFERAKRANVAAVHVNVKQDEDDERPSGQVFYASTIAPIAAGYEKFDALAAAVTEGHKRGIKVFAWMPQFHDQAALRRHPEWQMTSREGGLSRAYTGKNSVEFFVNPIDPAVQAYQLSLILEVARHYNVDGIVLDWLRFDDVNMDTGPVTRQLAKKEIGLDPMLLNFSIPSTSTARWQSWRARKIAAYTEQVRQALKSIKPKIALTAFILPPEFTEVGQDLALFSSELDEVYPMAYFKDWHFPPSWVAGKLMADVAKKRTRNTAIKPTLDGTGTFADNVRILSAIHTRYPQVEAIAWFSAVYWQDREIDRIVRIHRAAAAGK